MNDLVKKHCKPCEGGTVPYNAQQTREMLKQLKAWIVEDGKLVKLFPFKNYYETMAFVNALAWISHRADHHPDLGVHYNRCVVTYSTHSAGGVTLNDVICAAQAERLIAGPA